MGLCASISLKNKKHARTHEPNSFVNEAKTFLLLGCSCRAREKGKKRRLQSIKLDMDSEVEAAVQGYGGMTSTPVQPLWQKRVLMGERCEMPRFSGLILYDERGFPLPSNSRAGSTTTREMRGTVKVALKDIL